jgi:hypothetical protein
MLNNISNTQKIIALLVLALALYYFFVMRKKKIYSPSTVPSPNPKKVDLPNPSTSNE